MTGDRSWRVASGLALATTVVLFHLIVIGSIVRTTGSGLACPDWPLCHGRLIPPMQFNVLVEWFHRLVALLASVLLFVTAGWVFRHRETRARVGGLMAAALLLLAIQVLLGALTVWKLLDASVVSGHLAVALMLFGTLVTIANAAHAETLPGGAAPLGTRPRALLPLYVATIVLVFGQSVLGGMVSTNHASLACPDWPTCNGEWFPPLEGLVGLQMAHRLGAYTLAALLLALAWASRRVGDPILARTGTMLLGLVVGQMVLGICNVLLGIPVWLSALHLAIATGILALAITATFRCAALPARREGLARAVAS